MTGISKLVEFSDIFILATIKNIYTICLKKSVFAGFWHAMWALCIIFILSPQLREPGWGGESPIISLG